MRLKFSKTTYFFLSVKTFFEALIPVCQILFFFKKKKPKIITYFLVLTCFGVGHSKEENHVM